MEDGTFEDLKTTEGEKLALVAKPRSEQVKVYEGPVGRYTKCEECCE